MPEPGPAELERARSLFMEALAAHERRDFARAADLLTKALEVVPDRVSVLSNLAAALVELGRAGEAQRHAARALELDPEASDLHALMARVLESLDQPRDALVHLTRSHVLAHGDADAHADHGLALLGAGRRDEAADSFKRAIAIDEKNLKSLVNLAALLLERGNAADALPKLEDALALDPGNASAWVNRGIALDRLARHEEALAAYDRALGLRPRDAGAWNNRGNTLLRLRRHADALAAFDVALEIEPRNVEAWSNRGLALSGLGRHDEALACYDKAFAVRPDTASVWSNRGLTLSALKREAEALACFDRAIAAQPALAEAWSNRGRMLVNMGRNAEAMEAFDRALEIDPALADAWLNRGNAHYQLKQYERAAECHERAMALNPAIDHALGGWIHAKAMACDWAGLCEAGARAAEAILAGKEVCSPFQAMALALPGSTLRKCAELCVARHFPPQAETSPSPGSGSRRLRVGYVSADFRDHPVGYQLLGLLRRHDEERIEAVGFSLRAGDPDAYQSELRDRLARFHDLSALTPDEAREVLRAERLDIAVDLVGYTERARMELFAGRVAPIQVNFLCPSTSGAPYIDYILADAHTIPEQHHAAYSECVVTLPGSFFITDYLDFRLKPGLSRGDEGLPASGMVFASFCESYKITPEIWQVWMRLLRQVPQSVLWMGLRNNAQALANLRREAQGWGVAPERIVVARVVPRREDHLARLARADLCLDTPVYNGHTTTADALWAGVPVLTVSGGTFSGRVATSILHAARMPELVARDLSEYEATALRLARNPAELAALRARLARDKTSLPIFDTARAVHYVESAFRMMVERHRKGLPPESFAVPEA